MSAVVKDDRPLTGLTCTCPLNFLKVWRAPLSASMLYTKKGYTFSIFQLSKYTLRFSEREEYYIHIQRLVNKTMDGEIEGIKTTKKGRKTPPLVYNKPETSGRASNTRTRPARRLDWPQQCCRGHPQSSTAFLRL